MNKDELVAWQNVASIREKAIRKLERQNDAFRAALIRTSLACKAELSDVESVPTPQLAEPYGTLRLIEDDITAVLAEARRNEK